MEKDKIERLVHNSVNEIQNKLQRLNSTKEIENKMKAKKRNLNCKKCCEQFNKLSELIVHLRQHKTNSPKQLHKVSVRKLIEKLILAFINLIFLLPEQYQSNKK